jgi:chromosome segregation ATPase
MVMMKMTRSIRRTRRAREKKFTLKKKGKSYVATWDDINDDDKEPSDDDDSSNKKKMASLAIHHKPSLFDIPSCFMAKSTKVQYDESDSECDSEDESDVEEPSKKELLKLLEEAHELMNKKRGEFKDLRKKNRLLEQSLGDLKDTHERLKEAHEQSFDELKSTHKRLVETHGKLESTHERLVEAHEKLKDAHSSLLAQEKHVPPLTTRVGLTCDILNELTLLVAQAHCCCSN